MRGIDPLDRGFAIIRPAVRFVFALIVAFDFLAPPAVRAADDASLLAAMLLVGIRVIAERTVH